MIYSGGRIHDVHYAFLAQYAKLETPMDVILACGVNNMPTTDSAKERERERENIFTFILLPMLSFCVQKCEWRIKQK